MVDIEHCGCKLLDCFQLPLNDRWQGEGLRPVQMVFRNLARSASSHVVLDKAVHARQTAKVSKPSRFPAIPPVFRPEGLYLWKDETRAEASDSDEV